MIDGEEQEILLNTLAETPQEEVHTIEEDIYVIGVESLNGQAGDLTLKSINGENLVGEGNIALQTPLNQAQLNAVNSGIDSTKVGQIATNATNITTLQNTKQDNLTQAQLNAVNSGIDATKVAQIATNTGNITSVTNRVTTIEGKIPSAASSSNKLTDKNYVDNAIATNTANYISDNGQPFQSYADLVAYSGSLTNNDYAFVETIDQAGNDIYTRYKYNADQNLWAEEYTITNPYFTSDQWASINSGIAANDVAQIGTNKTDIATLQNSKQDKLTTAQQAAVDSGIDATKVQQIATNTTNIATKQDKLIAGTNIQIATDGKTISATDTKYTAGTGLTLTGTQFSVTEPVPSGFFTDTTTSQTSEGTDLTINGTTEAPLKNVELKGDTFQQTYEGKNLMPTLNTERTLAGVTFTPNPDGSITLNGTSTEATSYHISADSATVVRTVRLEPGTYTLNGDYNDGYFTQLMYQPVGGGSNVYARATFTLTEPVMAGEYLRIRAAGYTFNNLRYYPQLEAGSTATDYEPYVGGQASPNPDYPQDINVVTGEQTVSVVGKNLCSSAIELGNINNTTGANESSTTVIRTTDYVQVLPDKTYTISQNAPNVVYEYAADKTFLGTKYVSSTAIAAGEYTFSTSSSTAYLRWKKNVRDTALRFQLELGSAATAYEPYQSQSYKVNLGKNLMTMAAAVMTNDTDRQRNFYISLPAGDYVVSFDLDSYELGTNASFGIYMQLFDSSQTAITDKALITIDSSTTTGRKSLAFNLPRETTEDHYANIRISATNWNNGARAILSKIQIEAGSTATAYAPYFTPIELCGIEKKPDGTYTYQDYIWRDNDTWKIHKEVGKAFVSLNTQVYTLTGGLKGSLFSPSGKNSNAVALCNRATQTSGSGTLWPGCFYNNHANFMFIGASTDDSASLKAKYDGATLYFTLATPTDTAITDETLIGQLEALWNATSYNPQTNILSATPAPNLPAILTVDTFKNNWAGTLAGYQETINRLEARVEELEA